MTKWNSADRRWKNSKRGNISVLSEGGGQGSEWQRRGVGRMERRGMWVCAETSSEMSALEGTGGIYCKQYSKLIDTMINLNMTFADLFKRSNLIITPDLHDLPGVNLLTQRERMLLQQVKGWAQSFRFTPAVFLNLDAFMPSPKYCSGQNGVLPWLPEWAVQSQHLQVSAQGAKPHFWILHVLNVDI